MRKNVIDAMVPEETKMADFVPLNPYAYPILLNTARDKESYLKNLDSDTRAYVLRTLDDSCTIADIEECIRKLKG